MSEAFGFVRVATSAPPLRVANPEFNSEQTVQVIRDAYRQGTQLLLFPELGLTGYTCGELFLQDTLLADALHALSHICQVTETTAGLVVLVGLPLVVEDRLFNVQAVVQNGKIKGLVPKTYRPEQGEFMESHWFASSIHYAGHPEIDLFGLSVPLGANLIFRVPDVPNFVFGVSICEDDWVPIPRAAWLSIAGARIICNASASNELVAKADYRREVVVRGHAQTCLAVYVYASAGPWESTTNTVFGGHCLIAENSEILGESTRFEKKGSWLVRDVDVDRIGQERRRSSGFREATMELKGRPFRQVIMEPSGDLSRPEERFSNLQREVCDTPFVPQDIGAREAVCEEIFRIQTTALWRRLMHVNTGRMVLGISGGLDSTHAALVLRRTFDAIDYKTKELHLITMPGFGTSERTLGNAIALGRALTGREVEVIDIRPACLQHFRDIGHPAAILEKQEFESLQESQQREIADLVFQNVQARERKQILLDRAGMIGAIEIGTSDLTELALGWCTFNGDHISNYHINAGIPKTLIRYLIEYVAETQFDDPVKAVLKDILQTPISPELLPPCNGDISQKTEEQLGPFVVHDFFLYCFCRGGYGPAKSLFLASQAFENRFSESQLKGWLLIFLKRFFSSQFKSNCLPDGPKVGTISFDPRSDWRMPSDADVHAWISDLQAVG